MVMLTLITTQGSNHLHKMAQVVHKMEAVDHSMEAM